MSDVNKIKKEINETISEIEKNKYIKVDTYLEKDLDRIKFEVWLNEEFQYQPLKMRKQIFEYIKKDLFGL